MDNKWLKALLASFALAAPAFGAADWARTNTEVLVTDQVRENYEYRFTNLTTSEDLDLRRCTGNGSVKWDRSVSSGQNAAVAGLYSCPTNGAAIGTCTLRATLDSTLQRWEDGDDATVGLGGAPLAFMRVVPSVAPTGGQIAAVHIECLQAAQTRPREETVLFDSYNHTVLDFQHPRDTACNGATCTPNDALTPMWVRQAIGAAVADTFAQDSTYGVSGEAILDPGTAASTGVQYALPATQSLILNQAVLGRSEQRRYAFRTTFYRSGTTVIPAFGLCLTNSANSTTNMLTTAGALNVTAQFAVVWNASGTFTIANSASPVTTTQSYDSNDYHELTIRSVKRNIGQDAAGNHLPSGAVDDAVLLEIDGVTQFTVPFNGLPIVVSALQMVPCVAAVNVGGTADALHIADLEWHTPKVRPNADTN